MKKSDKNGRIKSVAPDEPLPIKRSKVIFDTVHLFGRMIGLIAQISKRTDHPIGYNDEILEKDDLWRLANARIASVITDEELRVLRAILEEYEWVQSNFKRDAEAEEHRYRDFMSAWYDVRWIFRKGGNIYDLLVFTDREYLVSRSDKSGVYGYREGLPDANLHRFKDESIGLYGLKDKDGNIVLKAEYDNIRNSGYSGRGWLLSKDGKWGAVNERLEWMFPIEYESILRRYKGGHFLKKGGKWAFCNSDGEILTDFIYDQIDNYIGGWGGSRVRIGDKYGHIDDEGKLVVPIEYDGMDLPSTKSLVRIKKDGLYGYIDLEDGTRIEPQFSEARDFCFSHPNEAAVKVKGLWGVIDRKGNFILEPEYDSVEIEAPNGYRVKKDGLEVRINKDR